MLRFYLQVGGSEEWLFFIAECTIVRYRLTSIRTLFVPLFIAVNSGICLLYSILLATDAVTSDSGLNASEFAVIGGVSFALTAINILCIWVSGIVMFEIKEVAPTKEKSE